MMSIFCRGIAALSKNFWIDFSEYRVFASLTLQKLKQPSSLFEIRENNGQ